MARIKSPFRVIGRVREKLRRNNIETPIHPGIFDLHVDGSTPEASLNKGIRFNEMHQIGEVDVLIDGDNNMQDISFPGMIKGGYIGAFVNAFPLIDRREPTHEEFWAEYRRHAGIYERAARENPNLAVMVGNRQELLDATFAKKLAMIKSVEGLYIPANEKGIKILDRLIHDGVRSVGILWNIDNEIGTSQKTESEGSDFGLTDFGQEVIEFLNETPGVVIDVSHCSAKTMEDILNIADSKSGKVIATHAGLRGKNKNTRNLPPEIAKAIGENGIIGIPLHKNLIIDDEYRDNVNVTSNANDVVKRIIELRELLGSSEHIGIGTDFGGLRKNSAILGLEDVTSYGQCLYEKMIKSKEFKNEEIEGIFNKNALRFFAGTLPEN